MSVRELKRRAGVCRNVASRIMAEEAIGNVNSSSSSLSLICPKSVAANLPHLDSEGHVIVKTAEIMKGLESKEPWEVRRALQFLRKSVEPQVSRRRNALKNELGLEVVHKFVWSFSGVNVLMAIFRHWIHEHDDDNLKESVRAEALDTLVKLMLHDCKVCDIFSADEQIIIEVFSYISSPAFSTPASKFVELALVQRETLYNLCSVRNIRQLLESVTSKEIGPLCKILSVSLDDHICKRKLCNLQNRQKLKYLTTSAYVHMNQELILGVPGFIEKLLDFATDTSLNSLSPAPGHFEKGTWLQQVEQDLLREQSVEDSHEEMNSMIESLNNRTEAMYVLNLILSGTSQKAVQQRLANCQVSKKLVPMLERFIWKSHDHQLFSTHLNLLDVEFFRSYINLGAYPEDGLKTQCLRLIFSFCDQNMQKYVLLTSRECEEVRRINSNKGFNQYNEGSFSEDNSLMCNGSAGVITTIVKILKKENSTSKFRYWLCRSLESFLRGHSAYGYQTFLLRRDLLDHLVHYILNVDIIQSELIQASFDLLGEMIKFNFEACCLLDFLLNTENKLKKFIIMIEEYLIDSNMFIRALILTCDALMSSGHDERNRFAQKSRIFSFFRGFEKQTFYASKLVCVINLDNLTQDNVSCLNTALIILMLHSRRGSLPKLLSTMKSITCDHTKGDDILLNLYRLLLFWKDHYIIKERDCTELERGSQIPLDFWQSTIEDLTRNEVTNPICISHYVEIRGTH